MITQYFTAPKNLDGRFLVADELIQLNDLVGTGRRNTYWRKSILYDTPLNKHLVGQYFRPYEIYQVDSQNFYVAPQDEDVIDVEVVKEKKMNPDKLKAAGILKGDYA